MKNPRDIWTFVNLLQVATLLREELEEALARQTGLTLAEHEGMMQLMFRGGQLPMGELAELVMFSQSGVTRLVDRLVSKGYVERKTSSEDRRMCYASLTDSGRAKIESGSKDVVDAVVAEHLSRQLPAKDIAELRRILLEILHANGWWNERQRTHQETPDTGATVRSRPASKG